jgi:NitT/TauT family transport system substrate-binding protein/putative hydroxymethylpyrimidine transport system substrate-binding protein
MRRLLAVPLILGLLAVALAACGSNDAADATRETPTVTVALDFTPNAIHASIYAAVREGADRAHGIRIEIQKPGSQPDSLKLVLGGAVDVGILDIQDLGLARQEGKDVVGFGALVQQPLAALIAQPDVRRPRDLEGRTVGVSGLPSDPAFVEAIVRHDGGDPSRIRLVTIGFAAVSALLSGKVAAVPAFWNAEGVVLRRKGRDVREFRVEDYGAPRFPEVVLVTRRDRLDADRDLMARFVAAIQDGARSARAHPDAAAREIARAAGSADVGLVRAQLDAVRRIADPSLRLDPDRLRAWADFATDIGILRERPDIARAFDVTLTSAPADR